MARVSILGLRTAFGAQASFGQLQQGPTDHPWRRIATIWSPVTSSGPTRVPAQMFALIGVHLGVSIVVQEARAAPILHCAGAGPAAPALSSIAGRASVASISSIERPLVSKPSSQNATPACPYQKAR